MEIKILTSGKEEMEFSIDNLTLAEILKVYLNKDSGVTFAAWKRGHPTEDPIVKVKTNGKTAQKAVKDALGAVTKDIDRVLSDFSK